MSSSVLGSGLSPAGTSPAGYGSPATTTAAQSQLYIKRDGTRGNARLIDPQTGDYVLDDWGAYVGCDAVEQMVYLALATDLGSSVQSDLGLELAPGIINESTPRKIDLAIRAALKSLIDRRLIELVRVRVERAATSRMDIQVDWRDVQTKLNKTTPLTR